MTRRDDITAVLAEVVAWGGAGAATGSTVAAAAGAAAPVASRIGTWAIDELATRVLSKSEERKVATVLDYMREAIDAYVATGAQMRDDGFFDETPDARCDGEEVFEGVLIAVQRDHEEKKLAYYARLIASVAYLSWIDAETGRRVLRLTQELSYTQLAFLALVTKRDRFPLPPDNTAGRTMSWYASSVREALDDLGYGRKELVYAKQPERDEPAGGGFPESIDPLPTNIGFPADLELANIGKLLYGVMGLSDIPDADLAPLAAGLWDYYNGVPSQDLAEPAVDHEE